MDIGIETGMIIMATIICMTIGPSMLRSPLSPAKVRPLYTAWISTIQTLN